MHLAGALTAVGLDVRHPVDIVADAVRPDAARTGADRRAT
jgi:hypothetical protein